MVAPVYECVFSSLSRVRLFVTPWAVARQAPLSVGFSRQEHWSGLPCPPPGNLPHPGIKPTSPAMAGGFFTTEMPGEPFLSVSQYQSERGRQRLTPHGAEQAAGVCFLSWFSLLPPPGYAGPCHSQ